MLCALGNAYSTERLEGSGAGVARGLGPRRWIRVGPPREQVAAEGCDADGDDHRAPGGEEEPSGIGEKRITQSHGIDPSSIFCFQREASQSGLAPGNKKLSEFPNAEFYLFRLLLRRSRRSVVHVVLHAGFVVGFHLLRLGLLVRG